MCFAGDLAVFQTLVDAAGEVSLTGRVLPIGGVKEKLLAARRSGVKTVIFPRTNERDYKELTGAATNDISDLSFVSTSALC